ncbi:MAG: DUF4935 domain-containing protein [Candidatus Pacearchaeota archaeon]|nr:MAG: DUF4935 domain-containing protein [Candidatus Pacearchaeota archaeon]
MPTQTGKSLIVVDTNIIRTKQDWESDFFELSPKGTFTELIYYIEKNNLQNLVNIAIPEIVIEEFSESKKENFNNSLTGLKKKLELFKKMPCCDFSNIKLPEESFDYGNYITQKINELITAKNFIKIIKIDATKSHEVLEDLKKRVFEGKKPFKKGSDRGFKDSLIWHCFLHNVDVNTFDYFYFLSENSEDFNEELKEEFESRFQRNLNFFTDVKEMISNLNEYYYLYEDYPEIIAHLQTDYFKGQLMDFISDILGIGINNFEIINFCKGIEEMSLEKFYELELQEEFPDEIIEILKLIQIEIKNEGIEYLALVIFDFSSNTIVDVRLNKKDGRLVI